MSDQLITAVIAGGVSLVVSLISYWAILKKIGHEKSSLEREINVKWIEKVYEERFRLYPQAFAITGLIQLRASPEFIIPREQIDRLRKELNIWAGEAGLFVSRDTARAYMELRTALSKRPGSGDKYSQEQAQKIWTLRNQFRRSLRNDVEHVYVGDHGKTDPDDWGMI